MVGLQAFPITGLSLFPMPLLLIKSQITAKTSSRLLTIIILTEFTGVVYRIIAGVLWSMFSRRTNLII